MQDSPLSVTSSIAGLLTLAFAVLAAIYARIQYLRNADAEYFRVKTSLSWYKTESIWMLDLISAANRRKRSQSLVGTPAATTTATTASRAARGATGIGGSGELEYQMYVFVLDQIGHLEERILELLTETETRAAKEPRNRWTLVPQSWGWSSSVAVAWLPIRTKAMDLVRQRDALGQRVMFAQMAMIASRVNDLETRQKMRREEENRKLDRLETMILDQHQSLQELKKSLRLQGVMFNDQSLYTEKTRGKVRVDEEEFTTKDSQNSTPRAPDDDSMTFRNFDYDSTTSFG